MFAADIPCLRFGSCILAHTYYLALAARSIKQMNYLIHSIDDFEVNGLDVASRVHP